MITSGLLIFPLSTLTTTCATSTEHLYLTARGDNIVPTIGEGDMVRVKFRVDGNLMNAGDVMVFCIVVARDPLPGAMWIGTRVIEKHTRWNLAFQDKGDNNPEPDQSALAIKKREGLGLFLLSMFSIDN